MQRPLFSSILTQEQWEMATSAERHALLNHLFIRTRYQDNLVFPMGLSHWPCRQAWLGTGKFPVHYGTYRWLAKTANHRVDRSHQLRHSQGPDLVLEHLIDSDQPDIWRCVNRQCISAGISSESSRLMRHASAPRLILDSLLEETIGSVLQVVAHYNRLEMLELMNLSLDQTAPGHFQRILTNMKTTSVQRRGSASYEMVLRLRCPSTIKSRWVFC